MLADSLECKRERAGRTIAAFNVNIAECIKYFVDEETDNSVVHVRVVHKPRSMTTRLALITRRVGLSSISDLSTGRATCTDRAGLSSVRVCTGVAST